MVAIWSEDTLVPTGNRLRVALEDASISTTRIATHPRGRELIVYGFDDTALTSAPQRRRSLSEQEMMQNGKKFRFTAEQFTRIFSASDLGASYSSVWIPWDAVGGDQKKITLMPTFIGKENRVVRGESAKLNLTGRRKPGLASQSTVRITRFNLPGLHPTGQPNALPIVAPGAIANQPGTAPAAQSTGMKTTTIRLNQRSRTVVPRNLMHSPQAVPTKPEPMAFGTNFQLCKTQPMPQAIPQPPLPSVPAAITQPTQGPMSLSTSFRIRQRSVSQSQPLAFPSLARTSRMGWITQGHSPAPHSVPLVGFPPNQYPIPDLPRRVTKRTSAL